MRDRRPCQERSELKRYYAVVIVGGGAHALAAAHQLCRRGISDVAVLAPGPLAGDATAPGTTILCCDGATPQAARLYQASAALYDGLARELGGGLVSSRRSHVTLAHDDRAAAALVARAQVSRMAGGDLRFVDPDEVERLVPALSPAHPVAGALHQPARALVCEDAVVRGFARAADAGGAELHPHTEVTEVERRNGRVRRLRTPRGDVEAAVVLDCTGTGASLAGVRLPITTHLCQACVTEPFAPLLDAVVVSAETHVCTWQSDRGEVLLGGGSEPWPTHRTQGTLEFLREVARRALELFPQLEHARVRRSWAWLCDLTPDRSPILGTTEVENLHLSAGWGTSALAAAPIVGQTLAELVDTGRTPELIAPFALERFYEDRLLFEPPP